MEFKFDYAYNENGSVDYINIVSWDRHFNKEYETTRFSKCGNFRIVTCGDFINKGYGYGNWS